MVRKTSTTILAFLAFIFLIQVPILGVIGTTSYGASPVTKQVTELNVAESFSLSNGTHVKGLFNSTSNGINPRYIQYDPQDNRIYVAEAQTNSVSVINAANRTLEKSINVGQYPNWEAYDPYGHFLFTANSESNNISVISTINDSNIYSINLGAPVISVAFDQSNGNLYAAYGNSSLAQISIPDYRIVFHTNVSQSDLGINGLFVGPSGINLFITSTYAGGIIVFNINTKTTMSTIYTGTYLPNIAFDTKENTMITTGTPGGPSQILEVSLSNYSVVRSVYLNQYPGPIALDPNINTLFVTFPGTWNATAYNATSLKQTHEIYTRYYLPTFLDYVPQLNAVIYTNTWINDIRYINPDTMNVTYWVALGEFPTGATYDPNNGNIYYTTEYHGNISVINPSGNRSWVITGLGAYSTDAAYSPSDHNVYFTYGSYSIGEVNTSNNTAFQVYRYPNSLSSNLGAIVYDSSNGMFYTANPQEGTVGVFNPVNHTLFKLIYLQGVSTLAYDSHNGNIYAGYSYNSVEIAEINSSTDTVTANVTLRSVGGLTTLVYDPANDMLYAGGIGIVGISPSLILSSSSTVHTNSTRLNSTYISSASYDPVTGTIFIGTGSGTLFDVSENLTVLAQKDFEDQISSIIFDNSTGQIVASLYVKGNALVIGSYLKETQQNSPFLTFSDYIVISIAAAVIVLVAGLIYLSRKR